jgi:GMP synthase (glutamine-hydrolysing)
LKNGGRALVLQHTPTEGPERVAAALRTRGIAAEIRAVYAGEAVPDDVPPADLVVSMGGPMGVGDVGDPRYPFLRSEIALIEKLIAHDTAVLGICLGSQLLAAAAGARVYPNLRSGPDGQPVPVREVGWAPVDFLNVEHEPVLAGIPARAPMLHWHGDTFDLPPGAVHLASTPVCANQAFRLGRRQIGFQFHCELEAETIGLWTREDAEFVQSANGPHGGAKILADTQRFYPDAQPIWDRLLANALDVIVA